MEAQAHAAGSKRLAFDIDREMTDGAQHHTDDSHGLKIFNVQDGLGIELLQRQGFAIESILTAQGKPEAAFVPDLELQ